MGISGLSAGLRDRFAAMRPTQWVKNVVVPAAFFFAFWDRSRAIPLGLADLGAVLLAAVLFCLVSSGVYLLNDIRDREADRHHPLKRRRPLAAGRVSPAEAGRLAAVLLLGGGLLAWWLSPAFFAVAAAYVAMQLVYTCRLKTVPLVDIMVIAAGFVLRALAGALVIGVTISPWLLLCTFLLALFLALCKRRHEKVVLADAAERSRPALQGYDAQLLDQLIVMAGGATLVSYAIYTLWPQTVAKFGTHGLGFTVPFVVFGLFRYLDLVYRHDKGDRPERILLSDGPLLATVLLYGVTAVAVFLFSR
ncbi:MAG: decaprenyl-phosphate phosphoribosyltransferase [Lentisphaerae bacterium]|nr:decaprenyl-phosphate phosphoribosyltransferase [Lentisphaerota bacterium]